MIILVDMDNVITDLDGRAIEMIKALHPDIEIKGREHKFFPEIYPGHEKEFEVMCYAPELLSWDESYPGSH